MALGQRKGCMGTRHWDMISSHSSSSDSSQCVECAPAAGLYKNALLSVHAFIALGSGNTLMVHTLLLVVKFVCSAINLLSCAQIYPRVCKVCKAIVPAQSAPAAACAEC
eukprot:1156369-Pelagomonas_calceolata.AAC.5